MVDSHVENVHGIDAISLERYKFVLSQKDELNKRTFLLLTFYQLSAIALLAGACTVLWGWNDKGISADAAKISISGVLIMFGFLSFFTIASLIAGVMSWMDYRREEFQFLQQAKARATSPSFSAAWRWHETYLGISVAAVFLFVLFFTVFKLMPKFVSS